MSNTFTKEQWAEIRRQTTDASIAHIAGLGTITAGRLPDVLLGYQSRAVQLMLTTSVLVVEKSRRVGLTWGLASGAALVASLAKPAGGMDVMYISYSQEMTREFIDACAMWARAFAAAALEIEEFVFEPADAEGHAAIKAFRIQFASGFEILALSSAPRGLRGKQGLVIIDEAAFVDSLKELLKAALAFLMWGGKVVIVSTHNGTDNPFNELVQDVLAQRKPYAYLRVDFDEALQQGLYQRICLVTGKAWSAEAEAEWRQGIIDFYGDGADEELFCVPSQGSGAWLTGPLIEARMTIEAPVLRLELPADYLYRPELEREALMAPFLEELDAAIATLDPDERHAFGFDFARVADLSVGTLLATAKTLKRRERLTFELRNVPGDEQKLITRRVLKGTPRLVGAAFDATGMGWTVAEDMGRLFGLFDKVNNETGLVRAIKFSQDWYRLEMPPLKVLFEDGAIELIIDADHVSDLRVVKVVRGIPIVPEIRVNEKADGGKAGRKRHGDFAIALALAAYASRMQWTEFTYTSVEPPAGKFEEPAGDGGSALTGGMFESAGGFRMSSLRRERGVM